MNLRKIAATAGALAVAATSLVACGGGDDTITVGTTDGSRSAWGVFENKAHEAGINMVTQEFSDYSTPNDALAQGALDANQFQTLKFLAEYNAGSGEKLTPVGSTEIVPLALFWKGHDSLDGIEGQTVAIPNDPANQGRAINVLSAAKLLTLKNKDAIDPTPADIDEGASKVKVTTVDAAQTAVVYGEGRPAVINNSFLDRAGIDPKSAVFQDDPSDPRAEPYINVFVTRAEDKDNEKVAKLVEVWHSPEVQKALAEDTKGTSVAVERSPEELQQILDKLEESAAKK